MLRCERPWAALGLAAGPAAFVAAWSVGGTRTPGYSAVDDAISRLAAVGAPERTLMTAGFVVYGAAVLAGSVALRRSSLSAAALPAAVNALATLAVAATPLDRSATVDLLHGVAATTGYVSLALVPAVAAGPLARLGHRRAAGASWAVAGVAAACLALTATPAPTGLFQRLGLTTVDAWLVACGIALWPARPAGQRRSSRRKMSLGPRSQVR